MITQIFSNNKNPIILNKRNIYVSHYQDVYREINTMLLIAMFLVLVYIIDNLINLKYYL